MTFCSFLLYIASFKSQKYKKFTSTEFSTKMENKPSYIIFSGGDNGDLFCCMSTIWPHTLPPSSQQLLTATLPQQLWMITGNLSQVFRKNIYLLIFLWFTRWWQWWVWLHLTTSSSCSRHQALLECTHITTTILQDLRPWHSETEQYASAI